MLQFNNRSPPLKEGLTVEKSQVSNPTLSERPREDMPPAPSNSHSWIRRSLFAFISAGVGAGFMYVAMRPTIHPQFLDLAREQSIQTQTERDKTCEQFGQQHRKKLGTNYEFRKIADFYSQKLDTCIETLESQIENSFTVVDIGGGFIKGSFDQLGDMGQGPFQCNSDGVDHVLIEKVREHHGYVDRVPYVQWMDDFNGGLPHTEKTPARTFTRKDCEEFFRRELREVR